MADTLKDNIVLQEQLNDLLQITSTLTGGISGAIAFSFKNNKGITKEIAKQNSLLQTQTNWTRQINQLLNSRKSVNQTIDTSFKSMTQTIFVQTKQIDQMASSMERVAKASQLFRDAIRIATGIILSELINKGWTKFKMMFESPQTPKPVLTPHNHPDINKPTPGWEFKMMFESPQTPKPVLTPHNHPDINKPTPGWEGGAKIPEETPLSSIKKVAESMRKRGKQGAGILEMLKAELMGKLKLGMTTEEIQKEYKHLSIKELEDILKPLREKLSKPSEGEGPGGGKTMMSMFPGFESFNILWKKGGPLHNAFDSFSKLFKEGSPISKAFEKTKQGISVPLKGMSNFFETAMESEGLLGKTSAIKKFANFHKNASDMLKNIKSTYKAGAGPKILGKAGAGEIPPIIGAGGAVPEMGGMGGGLGAIAGKLGLIGIAVGLILAIYGKIFQTFTSLEKSAESFRKTLGLTFSTTQGIQEQAGLIVAQWGHLGVKIDDVFKSLKAINDVIGFGFGGNAGIVQNISLFAAQLGVAQETSAEFLKVMAQVSGTTLDVQQGMLMTVGGLSEAAQTNLGVVMTDISKSAEMGYSFLSKNPKQLALAAIQARMMGSSLQSTVQTAKGLLNFTESVNSEMEMDVLLGKSINLQRARELAYRKDDIGLQTEILSLLKQTNFEQLDPFQQEAVAKALGKSVNELSRMAESSREMAKQGKSFYEISKSQHQLDIMRRSNQSALTALTNTWAGIFYDLSPILIQISNIIREVSSGLSAVVHNPLVHWTLQHAGMLGGALMPVSPTPGVGQMGAAVIRNIPTIPPVGLESLNKATGNVGENKEGYLHQKFDEFIGILEDHKKATQDLHKDLKNGSLTANVFLDSQKLDSAVGRRLAYTGTLT